MRRHVWHEIITMVSEGTEPQISLLLTLSINIIFYGAGVATPDPGEAPPLAGFNMKSPVASSDLF